MLEVNRVKKIDAIFFVIRDLLAVGIALVVSFLLIFIVSDDAWEALSLFLFGPLQTVSRVGYIVEKMIPLLFTGVGVSLMFRCKQVNMGSEGAFYLGGVISTAVAVKLALPAGIHPVACMIAAGLVGALVCGTTAVLHTKFHALTIVTSLMLNYICLYFGQYLINNPLWDPSAGFQASYKYAETALLPKIFSRTNIHAGLFIALLAVVFGHFLIEKSTLGYKIRTVGYNPKFAAYAGINVTATIILCQMIGGFLAGLGGAVEQLGMYKRFEYAGLSGHGSDGVMIAVIAGNNPKYVPISALFLAYVSVGAETMARMSDVPSEVVSIVQSIIIMFVVAEKFLAGWKHKVIAGQSIKQMKTSEVK
ncbi:MAG TPA: ABC transporter permease [Candidatus Pygmaiobacter gallistercoris]|nr:ABC transporter permease [Candidatus Pygmaiobacter gallistercoris]